MGFKKYKLNELIKQSNECNFNNIFKISDVRGISIKKNFIYTKADMTDVNLKPYKLVKPKEFSYVSVTSKNGEKITLAYNDTNDTYIVSSSYVVFYVIDKTILLPEYLFMYFNRPEFDRYARFHSWGSAREIFDWEALCDIEIELPDISIQQKYVDVYRAMVASQKVYEKGLDNLKLTCDIYIENLRRKMPCEKIGKYIEEVNERNINNVVKFAQGVNVNMQFIEPKRIADDFENGYIVRRGQFAYNKVMKANGTKLPIALCNGVDCVVSGSYQVFKVCNINRLIPEYLMLWFSRSETQRFLGFNSWGSTRDVISFSDLGDIKIPIPNISIQQSIVNIYNCYIKRKEINERLKEQIKNICPILIKGSLIEGEKYCE